MNGADAQGIILGLALAILVIATLELRRWQSKHPSRAMTAYDHELARRGLNRRG
jgi:hypothetical protein